MSGTWCRELRLAVSVSRAAPAVRGRRVACALARSPSRCRGGSSAVRAPSCDLTSPACDPASSRIVPRRAAGNSSLHGGEVLAARRASPAEGLRRPPRSLWETRTGERASQPLRGPDVAGSRLPSPSVRRETGCARAPVSVKNGVPGVRGSGFSSRGPSAAVRPPRPASTRWLGGRRAGGSARPAARRWRMNSLGGPDPASLLSSECGSQPLPDALLTPCLGSFSKVHFVFLVQKA